MQVADNFGTKEIVVHTVSITHNPKETEANALMFRCPYCADRVLRVQGKIVKITPGLEPAIDVTTLSFCQTCRRNYTFQTVVSKAKITKITLAARGAYNAFHCIDCRSHLLNYDLTHPIVALLPMGSIHTLPFIFECYRCRHAFCIADIVQEDV